MKLTELKTRQANGELTEAEVNAVLDTKREAEAARIALGDMLTGQQHRSIKSRPRKRQEATPAEYHGLDGKWLSYCKVATKYESHIPEQDRDDWRHDTMLELERAESRDGKPLPELRAYRIASLMIALYWRVRNRWSTKVCIFNGYPVALHCKDCPNGTGKPCAWLAVRPVARLDNEIIDEDGYRTRLLDTVASDRIEDMPDQWYDVRKLVSALPPRLAEIGCKKLERKALETKDRMYLLRYWKAHPKKLI